MIYLDNSATTRVLPVAAAAVNIYFTDQFFNISSAYGPAIEVERHINMAREQFAKALRAEAKEIVFTSGGTESNNMAIFGSQFLRRKKGRLITTMIEHASVYEPFRQLEEQGYEVMYVGARKDGGIDMQQLEGLLTQDTALVSVMHVNNEMGAVQDIAAVYNAVKKRAPEALLHVDGVQAFCKLPFQNIPCDLYSVSGHKFHGPKGVGMLYLRKGIQFAGTQIGGGQEGGLRSGTTNSPGIMGMHAAFQAYSAQQTNWVATIKSCKARLYGNLINIPDSVVNGPDIQNGAPHILNMSFPGVRGEVLLHALSEKGILVSTGSACSARKKGKNRILSAMGLSDERQESAIRFSLCPFNTMEEMDQAAQVVTECVALLRKYQRR